MEPCDPRIYMAAERTFLVWIRTGLALMGFGFIAARLGLLLAVEPVAAGSLEGHGGLPGVGLIILGVLVNVAAAFRHHRYLRAGPGGIQGRLRRYLRLYAGGSSRHPGVGAGALSVLKEGPG